MSWIVEEIQARGGAVRFRDFMELALYHPEHGYYSSEEPRYGRAGDFVTTPSASRWYGEVLAAWLDGIAKRVGPLTVIDIGSGDGSFIGQLLSAGTTVSGRWLREVVSIERSESMRRAQLERFRDSEPELHVYASVEEIRSTGASVVHASELFDAMPVHRAVARGTEILELWVESARGELAWTERPASEAVIEYFNRHEVALQDGQIAEANTAAEAAHLQSLDLVSSECLAVILDYGYEARRLYDPRFRASGSLACYRDHRMGRDPLLVPGEQDLTAHVNWDDLRRGAGRAGCCEVGLWPLAEFLVRAGIEQVVDASGLGISANLDARTVSERQEIKRLLDPDGMGSDLKVLVQGRGEIAEAARDSLACP
jgi:SAM-dependent MidA family methyltransferase